MRVLRCEVRENRALVFEPEAALCQLRVFGCYQADLGSWRHGRSRRDDGTLWGKPGKLWFGFQLSELDTMP